MTDYCFTLKKSKYSPKAATTRFRHASCRKLGMRLCPVTDRDNPTFTEYLPPSHHQPWALLPIQGPCTAPGMLAGLSPNHGAKLSNTITYGSSGCEKRGQLTHSV